MDSRVSFLVGLCGRLQLDGGYDPLPAKPRSIEHVLQQRQHDPTMYYLTIRSDALERFEEMLASVPRLEDGAPVVGALPIELRDDAHRLAQLVESGECTFKVGRDVVRRGKRVIQRNKGITFKIGDAVPCTLRTAVSLLTRYPAVLEPVEVQAPEPVKIKNTPTRRKAASKSK